MIRRGAPGRLVATAAVVLLMIAGPVDAIVEAPATPKPDWVQFPDQDPVGPLSVEPETDGSTGLDVGAGLGLPFDGTMGDTRAWFEWTNRVGLNELIMRARGDAPIPGAELVPPPDAFLGYVLAGDTQRREAWRAWWIATQVAATRLGATLDNGLGEATQEDRGQGPWERMHGDVGMPGGNTGLYGRYGIVFAQGEAGAAGQGDIGRGRGGLRRGVESCTGPGPDVEP